MSEDVSSKVKKIVADHLGIDVTVYTKQLHGKRLRGQTTGIVAVVSDCRFPTDGPEYTDVTLYVKYVRSGTDNTIATFEDGEVLIVEDTFTYGNTTISAGETIASLISEDATAIGSLASVGQGVFFVRGTFVGAINIPTIHVNKTKDITLGFIKLKNDCKLKTKPNLLLLDFVITWLNLLYFR